MQLVASSFSVALSASLAIGAWAADPQTSTTAHKKTSAAKHYTKSTTQAKSTAKTTTASTKRTSTTKKRPVAAVRHYAPQQPSPERYKEIQTALAAKGYFKPEPDGTWGPASVDALKRFQHDQNLTEDGKIGSLSLIALGLGPKREPADQPQKTVEPETKLP